MIELDSEQVLHVRAFLSVTAGILVLFIGKFLTARIAALREFNIPEPVTGGLLLAVAFGMVYLVSGIKVDFDLTARDILLVYFFTVIGINARVGDLLRGGKPLAALLAITLLSCSRGISLAWVQPAYWGWIPRSACSLPASQWLGVTAPRSPGRLSSPSRVGSQTPWRLGSSARPWDFFWRALPVGRWPAS